MLIKRTGNVQDNLVSLVGYPVKGRQGNDVFFLLSIPLKVQSLVVLWNLMKQKIKPEQKFGFENTKKFMNELIMHNV